MKRRYNRISDVKAGDKIIFSNTSNLVKELPKANYVGEVIEIVDSNMVKVKFILGPEKEIETNLSFFVLQ